MSDVAIPLKHIHEHRVTSVPVMLVRRLHVYICNSYDQLMRGTGTVDMIYISGLIQLKCMCELYLDRG